MWPVNLHFFSNKLGQGKNHLHYLFKKIEIFILLVLILFYVYSTRDLAWYWSSLLILPLSILNFFLVVYVARAIRVRLTKQGQRPIPELIVLMVILFGMIILFYWQDKMILFWLVTILLLWFTVQLYAGRSGLFYTGFVGVLLFSLVVFSHGLLYLEKRLLLWGMHYYHHLALVELLKNKRWQLKKSAKNRQYSLDDIVAKQGLKLSLPLPERLWLHDSRLVGFIYGMPEPGLALAYISASQQDPYASPALGLYLADQSLVPAQKNVGNSELTEAPNKTLQIEANKKQQVETMLIKLGVDVAKSLERRKDVGEVANIHYNGLHELEFVDKKQQIRGIGYSYDDLLNQETMHLYLFFAPLSPQLSLIYLSLEETSILTKPGQVSNQIHRLMQSITATHK